MPSPCFTGQSVMAVAWTDNKNYLISVRCVRGQRIWALIATTPLLSESLKETVIQQITNIGFNPDKVVYMPYKNC